LTERLCPFQRRHLGVATSVLANSDQTRYPATVDKFVSHHWPKTLRSDHHDVDIFSWNDRSIINRETVSKEKRLARSQIRSDFFFVDDRHLCIGQRKKDDV